MSKVSELIIIHTDGGCDKNPGGTGGWAFRIKREDHIIERSGRVANSTNNRMEMTAAIHALQMLKESSDVELFTDSQYLSKGITEWIHGWLKRNWKLKDGSPVKNVDLWKKLYALNQKHRITWSWVRGHADNADNVRVDQLVQQVIKGKVVTEGSHSDVAVSVPAEVKLIKRKGKPVSVTISLKPTDTTLVDRPVRLHLDWNHLPKLIEDLVKALREGEES